VAPKIKRGRVRILATIYLAKVANFFQTQCRSTDLNQAEDIFPAGFFASSGPAIAESTQRGKERKNHESIDSV
jgi:hypothetical protein